MSKTNSQLELFAEAPPERGEEVRVSISPTGEGTWVQMGTVRATWNRPRDFVKCARHTESHGKDRYAAIKITRSLTPEELGHDQTDDRWNDCEFVCWFCEYSGEWVAVWPISFHANRELLAVRMEELRGEMQEQE